MSSQQIIIVLIIACMIMLLWSLWKKELLGIICKVIIGTGIIWVINLIFPTIAIGINGITAAIIGVLGIPGLIMLYLIQILL